LWLILGLLAVLSIVAMAYWMRASRGLAAPLQRAGYEILHTADAATAALRGGLTAESATRAVPALRLLLATPAVALADESGLLAWDGPGEDHAKGLEAAITKVMDTGRATILPRSDLACDFGLDCPLRAGVAVPLTVEDSIVGVLVALAPTAQAGLLRAAGEVARFASTQLELAELDRSRTRAAEAELRFRRAQISPHFIYNALTAIASFVRSDPDRARALLLSFAEVTRYSFRSHGQFVTVAEELESVETYLELERARFGERLQVRLRVSPEVLAVSVPCLLVQPLVENAVRHGLEHRPGIGHIVITAASVGAECVITIEDDGIGMDPDVLREHLAGRRDGGIGLVNVDERLRQVYGPDHGITVETAMGAGTKVTVRVPKNQLGVRAS
jgi:two-component system LytT family sensor kinase